MRSTGCKPLKPKFNNKIFYAPREVRSQVDQWLINPDPAQPKRLKDIQEWLEKKHGIRVDQTTISHYYRDHCHSYVAERRKNELEVADKLYEHIQKKPGQFYLTAMDELTRRGMKMAMNDSTDPKELVRVITSLVSARKQSLEEQKLKFMERRLRILERRQAALEEALGKRSSKLNDDKFVERIRKVFQREEITHSGLEAAVTAANGHRNGYPA